MGKRYAVMFDALRIRLAELMAAPQTIAERAAPRIEAKLRADATTKRGNVPGFGALGGTVSVDAPAWVMKKANELGQTEEWAEIVAEEARDV